MFKNSRYKEEPVAFERLVFWNSRTTRKFERLSVSSISYLMKGFDNLARPEHLNESQSNFDPLKRGISNYMEGFCALSEHTQHAALNNQGTSLVGEPELAWARSSCPAAGGTINTQLSRALKADGFLRPDSTAILAAERPIQNFDIESSATARTSIVDIFRDDISTIRGSMDWTNDAKTGLAFEKLPEVSSKHSHEAQHADMELILPSIFLNLDLHCQPDHGNLFEYTNHENPCESFEFLESSGNYWVTPSGLSRNATDIVTSGVSNRSEAQRHDCFGNTAMHLLAARAEPFVLARTLHTTGYISAVNAGGQTFLHILKRDWYSSALPLLIDLVQSLSINKYDLQAQDNYGQTFAHIACRNIKDNAALRHILQLLGPGTSSKRDAFGFKPKDLSLADRSLDQDPLVIKESTVGEPTGSAAVQSLWCSDHAVPLGVGLSPDIVDHKKSLAATSQKSMQDVDTEDSGGRNGLHCLAARTFADLEPVLQSVQYQSSSIGPRTTSKLKKILDYSQRCATELLMEGVDVNAYSSFGNTALMDFVAYLPENFDNARTGAILQLLVKSGARLEARNKRGETALLMAAKYCRLTALKTLLRAGASPKARDAQGRDTFRIVEQCLSNIGRAHVDYGNFQGCLDELQTYQGCNTSNTTAISEWTWQRREQLCLGTPSFAEATGLFQSPTSPDLFTNTTLPGEGNGGTGCKETTKTGSQGTTHESQLGHLSFWAEPKVLLSEKKLASSNSVSENAAFLPTLLEGPPNATIMDSLANSALDQSLIQADLDASVDDICSLILEKLFGISTRALYRPQDARASVKRCLIELQNLQVKVEHGIFVPAIMSRTGENARDRKSMREDLSSSLPESSLPTKRSFDDIEPERGFCEIDDSAPAISWKKNATDWDGELERLTNISAVGAKNGSPLFKIEMPTCGFLQSRFVNSKTQ
ncbi:hypothetical protein GQ607_005364 [Colletotrichum asianum]|uniref:Ankyrin repeat protein n=1 Tax=Colletotrichum asianum TaxID=702518 RepID=A0A8H3ZQ07_9PEZI|nr:hypothetical protein GQ607_005364 [Colletotrichum asianum]